MPRIYADFNNADPQGRVRLMTNGSRADIEQQKIELSDGMKITIYDGDLSADAEAVFSTVENIWVAKIDWSKVTPDPMTE